MRFRWFNELPPALGPSLLQASKVGVFVPCPLPSSLPGCSGGQEANKGVPRPPDAWWGAGQMAPGYAHRPAQEIPAQNCLISRFKPSKFMPSLAASGVLVSQSLTERRQPGCSVSVCLHKTGGNDFYLMNFKLGGGRKHQQLRSMVTGRRGNEISATLGTGAV